MAEVQSYTDILIDGKHNYLTCEQATHFCNMMACINAVRSNEVPQVNFQLYTTTTNYLEVKRIDNTYIFTNDAGDSETLSQAQFNAMLNCCRGKSPTKNCNCGR